MNDLPPFLTIRQAAAWVQYRNYEAVEAAATLDGLSGYRLFSREPIEASIEDLRLALLDRRLEAAGLTDDGRWRTISPVEWTSLSVAPRDRVRQYPYSEIQIERAKLLNAFPSKLNPRRRGAPDKFHWDWVKEAAARESPVSQNQLAEVLIALYWDKFGNQISMSSMKRHLKDWGY